MSPTVAKRMRGFSMVEMGVALVVLGLLLTAAMAYWRMSRQEQVVSVHRSLFTDAQAAVLGFVHAHHRLPCPDTDGDGLEGQTVAGAAQCVVASAPTAAVGQLPWRTLGLLKASAGAFRMGVFRDAAPTGGEPSRDLAVTADRFKPIVMAGVPVAGAEGLIGQVNLFDTCYALNAASLATRTQFAAGTDTATLLAVREPVGGGNRRRHVAYVLAAPGLLDADLSGSAFDGLNRTASAASPTFEPAGRVRDAAYDDQVVAMGFDTLFSELQCGKALAATQHAHFNAAASAVILRQSLADYQRQLQLLADLAGAGVASATAGVLTASAGLANAVAASGDAIAWSILTYGAATAAIVAGVFAVGANTVAVAASGATLAAAIATKVEADQRVTQVQPLVISTAQLADNGSLVPAPAVPGVPSNAMAADEAGF